MSVSFKTMSHACKTNWL